MALLDDTKAILADLVAFPTVSADSNLDLIAYVSDRLAGLDARIATWHDETGQKANLFATIGPEGDGGIVLSGHTDVVPADRHEWQSDPFAMREADGRLYGRGTCDMKGFLAAVLAVAPRYAELDIRRPVHFSFTYDEETGCLGGRQLVEELRGSELRPGVAIIGEPTDMRIIEGHKGCYEYTTEFHGAEGHGSDPEAGVNAVEYAARYINRLLALADELRQRGAMANGFRPPWTTVQVGRIEGGSARNVIAGHCTVEWEMRPVAEADADYVKDHIGTYCAAELLPAMRRNAPKARIETRIIGEVEGLEPMPASEARDMVAALTGRSDTDLVPFGTEAGLFQSLGMSAVVCGPGSIQQAHKPDEYVSLDQLQACLNMLTGLERRLTG